jgi:hypothetical protein
MFNKPNEGRVPPKYNGIIKDRAQNVTEKDVKKVINKSEEIQTKPP